MVDLLIIGMGNMGSLHAKYASMLGVHWKWYDPAGSQVYASKRIEGSVRLREGIEGSSPYSHIIVATPAETHAAYLRELKDFDGHILMEKPGVLNREDLSLLDDPRVSVGLVERFNPAFETLVSNVEPEGVLNVDFVRCSARPVSRIKENSYFDVGLHDIDMLLTLLPGSDISSRTMDSTGNTFCLMAKMSDGQVARFIWSNETFNKERVIQVRQRDCNYVCNLIDQTVKRHSLSADNKNVVEDLYVEKASPVRRELESFFDGIRQESTRSHALFLDILENVGA